ncbi:serine/threonine-protein kinase MRCK [Nematocida minor]|uniref:serine/threonine-protein kinase MRCK n=1 Tax=Nematocida minor TaxID=1912983 RepID=UPI002220E4FC|nr:serine/threonine-protein kinase MRCK [Nematocida minor]KAI5192943.1 serine/threonine-protein kinase MRCK [Nematocida minor]
MREKRLVLGNKELGLLMDCAQAITFSGGTFPEIERIVKAVDKMEDYEVVHALAKGGHSEVFVVRGRLDGKIYALKKVFKQDILNDPLVNPVMRERESMICGRNSEWLLGLHKSFQDSHALYFLTDFIPGGDLGSLCCRKGTLPEEMIRFFIGELLMALKELHTLGFVHRDIKPENVLIDAEGHIKLADFGSSTRLCADDHAVVVGTPDYVAPELLTMSGGLSEKTDLWSVGVVVYELAFGITPFYDESIRGTYNNIMAIEYKVEECSENLRDLIVNLLCSKENRLDLEKTMNHAFFAGFSFEGKGANRVLYVPSIQGMESVENFEIEEFQPAQSTPLGNTLESVRKFIGFGYDPEIVLQSTEEALSAEDGKEIAVNIKNNLEIKKSPAETDDCSAASNFANSSPAEDRNETVLNSGECNNSENSSGVQNDLCDSISLEKEREERIQENTICAVCECARVKEYIMEESIVISIETSKKEEKPEETEESISITTEMQEPAAQIETAVCLEGRKANPLAPTEEYISAKNNGEQESALKKEYEALAAHVSQLEVEFQMGYEKLAKLSLEPLEKSLESIEAETEKYTQTVKESQKRESENAFQARWIIRKLQTEIRDAQSRIEREVESRTSLAEQIKEARAENKDLKEQIRRLKLASNVYNFPIKVYGNNKWESSTLHLEEDYLRIKDICLPISKLYFQNLKKNELLRINSKGELLSFKLLLPSEDDAYTEHTESSSDQTLMPGEDQELKKELEKEIKILEGIERMINTSSPFSNSIIPMALKQKEGTEKKIAEIRQALTQGVTSDPMLIRYNNHAFRLTNFKAGVQTWCHVCNRLLYGEMKQGLLCKGCKLVCHRECHTLIAYSCELQQAMERGTSIILMAKQLEDKERIKAIVGNSHS